jgi:hypothetical protein
MRKKNYLNNKDILKEIHKSKTTYCKYTSSEDADFDMILLNVSKINKTNVKEALKLRAERLAKLALDAALEAEPKTKYKLDEFKIKPSNIPVTDLVFRVMTFEHIPPKEPKKVLVKGETVDEPVVTETSYDKDGNEIPKKVKKESALYVKCNFPPFLHYRVTEDLEPYVVGKSHWKGTLEDGEFSKEHGQMTNKLAHMFMKLCERYATRSNWRGYTYNDEMRSQALLQLAQIGLQFDESKSQNPFAYYTAAITNSFTRVLHIEKKVQNIRDDILEMNDFTPSFSRQNAEAFDREAERNRPGKFTS